MSPSTLSGVRTILADHQKFQDFGSVMGLYVNFKCLQKNDIVPQARTVSALNQGCGGGGQVRSRSGHGRGSGGGCGDNSRAHGLVPQEEIDKVTNIENKQCPTKIYNTFTSAQKAKHWQLCNPGKTPGSGPTKSTKSGSGAPASAVSVSEFKTAMSFTVTAIFELTAVANKRNADESLESISEGGWGQPHSDNRDNRALARREAEKKSKN
jgi:hypothetical protein